MFLFLPIYLINNVFTIPGLENTLSYSIITISFTAGAITYIFAGYLSDKTRTRFGRRRPFLLLVIPAATAYIFLGVSFASLSIPLTFAFFAIMASIYAILYRFNYCAYWALYMDLTKPEERVTTSIIFNLFGTIGTVVALVLTPILQEVISFFMITLFVGLIFMGTVLFAFFFGPKEDLEKIQKEDEMGTAPTKITDTLKETISNKNFAKYLFASFFFVLGFQLSVLILIPYLEIQAIELLYLLPCILPIAIFYFIFFNRIAKSWGKLKAFRFIIIFGVCTIPITMFLGVVGTGVILFIQVLIIISLILFVVIAILSFQYAVLMDLTPTGREATYSGVYLFVIVIPIPIASALIGPIRDLLSIDVLNFWHGESFSFAIIFLITTIFLAISYIFLRQIQSTEAK